MPIVLEITSILSNQVSANAHSTSCIRYIASHVGFPYKREKWWIFATNNTKKVMWENSIKLSIYIYIYYFNKRVTYVIINNNRFLLVLSPHSGSDLDSLAIHGLSCKKSKGCHYPHGAINGIIHRALTTVYISSRIHN